MHKWPFRLEKSELRHRAPSPLELGTVGQSSLASCAGVTLPYLRNAASNLSLSHAMPCGESSTAACCKYALRGSVLPFPFAALRSVAANACAFSELIRSLSDTPFAMV